MGCRGSGGLLLTLSPCSWTTDLCGETPESSTYTSLVKSRAAKEQAPRGSRSDRAPAWRDENPTPCLPAPSHAAAAGSPAHAERAGCRTHTKHPRREQNLSQSPNGSVRGRTGRVSGTGEPECSQSQPTTTAGFPGSQHAGRHQKSPAANRPKPGLEQVSPPWLGGEQRCTHTSHPAPARPSTVGARDCSTATKHPFLSRHFSISPFPIRGFSRCGAKRNGHWYSLASNTSHAQPAPSERGLFCYSFLRQLLFHLSPCFATTQLAASSRVVVVLSFLKDVICIFSSYLPPLHFSPPAFPKAVRAGLGQMQGGREEPAPELAGM